MISLSSENQNHFLTNFVIFMLSVILSSFALDSYDRSFEVILITILMCSQSSHDYVTGIKNSGPREKLYNFVLNWFKQ